MSKQMHNTTERQEIGNSLFLNFPLRPAVKNSVGNKGPAKVFLPGNENNFKIHEIAKYLLLLSLAFRFYANECP